MLSLGAGPRRVYLAVGATDLRKGFDGLYGLVRSRLEEDPLSGQLFVFCNAGRTRVKALYFDGSGLWLCAKRLAKPKLRSFACIYSFFEVFWSQLQRDS